MADWNACTDGNPCTTDECEDGQCVSQFKCSDGDTCTQDSCNPNNGQCSYSDKSDGASCNDGDACTQSDECFQGTCSGEPKYCAPDGNPCTDDFCQYGGCVHPANDDKNCPDGAPCTIDYCEDGECKSVPKDDDDCD